MRPHLVAWLDGFFARDLALLLAPSWFTCVGLAGLVTLFVMLRLARRHGVEPGLVASAVLWGYLAAVTAGIVVPMIIDVVQQWVAHGRVRVRWAGMTSFWGYLAGLGAVALVCHRGRLPIGRFGDLAAAPLGLALVFARLGCFLAGCDYGKVTSGPLAVRFPSGSPAWRDHVRSGLLPPERTASLPVHPTQLYEAALGLVMVAVALWAAQRPWARQRGGGRVFLAAAATYALGRIGVEALRGDAGRGFTLGLSSGQIFSVLVLVAIGAGLVVARRRAGRAAGTAGAVVAAMAAVLGLAEPHPAEAQPGQPAPAPTPAPVPVPAPISPYDGPSAGAPAPVPPYPVPPPPPGPVVPPPAPSEATGRRILEAGVLLGWATPLNRRSGQVPPMAGPSVSVGLALGNGLGLWLDFDSLGNDDAVHGTLLLSGSMMTALKGGLELGGRLGIGSTLVNFEEPAFRDVAALTLRAEAVAEYALGDRWALWVRPISFDVLSHDALGGPITTWQMRVGLAHRFGPRRGARSAAPPAGPAAAPGTIASP